MRSSRSTSASTFAGDLELEPAVAVGGDHLFQRLGQAVADALGLVGARDRVDQADGVARGDRARRPQPGEEGVEVEAGQVGRRGGGAEAGAVAAHHLVEGLLQRAAQRVEHARGRSAPGRSWRPGCSGRAPRRARSARGSGARSGRRRCRPRRRGRARGRCASALRSWSKLSSLLRAGFLSNHFGASSSAAMPSAARAVVEPDAHAHEGLRRRGQRDHAEAEGHAQADVALEQVDAIRR